jgi:hypothetical protein
MGTLTPAQRRTLAARQAFSAQFASDEERSAHYRRMAVRSNAARVVLNREEARAFLEAFAVMQVVADRAQRACDAEPAVAS